MGWLRRLLSEEKKPDMGQDYTDGTDTRTWDILQGLDVTDAVKKYPDFDIAYVRAAYPKHAEDHQNANLQLLLEGLDKSIMKSRILTRLSNFYVWSGDAEKALNYAVQSLLALKTRPNELYVQPIILLREVFSAKGYQSEAAKLEAIRPRYTLGPKEQSDVTRIVRALSSPQYHNIVEQARNRLMSFLKNLFDKEKQEPTHPEQQTKSRGRQYMFSALGLPREKMSLEERVTQQQKEKAESIRLGGVGVVLNWQDFARGQPPNSPLLVTWQGRALSIARLDNMPRSEAHQMRSAVEQGRVLLAPVFAPCPTYTIFGPRFVIFDDPSNPYTVEDPRDIALADVQDFISAVLNNGEGDFYLYWGANAEPVATGTFSLCMNPQEVTWPHKPSDADREAFWQLLNQATSHFKGIPAAHRNFGAAVKYYFEKTSL
jgi:hypothetical protein